MVGIWEGGLGDFGGKRLDVSDAGSAALLAALFVVEDVDVR